MDGRGSGGSVVKKNRVSQKKKKSYVKANYCHEKEYDKNEGKEEVKIKKKKKLTLRS